MWILATALLIMITPFASMFWVYRIRAKANRKKISDIVDVTITNVTPTENVDEIEKFCTANAIIITKLNPATFSDMEKFAESLKKSVCPKYGIGDIVLTDRGIGKIIEVDKPPNNYEWLYVISLNGYTHYYSEGKGSDDDSFYIIKLINKSCHVLPLESSS